MSKGIPVLSQEKDILEEETKRTQTPFCLEDTFGTESVMNQLVNLLALLDFLLLIFFFRNITLCHRTIPSKHCITYHPWTITSNHHCRVLNHESVPQPDLCIGGIACWRYLGEDHIHLHLKMLWNTWLVCRIRSRSLEVRSKYWRSKSIN